MNVTFEDRRLEGIREKVEAGQRLSYEDGITLYRSSDLLALGYMANIVRERLHGDVTYFNVNRHINPTDVCVASCRLMRVWKTESAIQPPIRCRSNRFGTSRVKAGARRSPNSTLSAVCIRS